MFRVRCPICSRDMEVRDRSEWPNFPFCSERCRIIDLGRWLGGGYRVPAPPADAEPDEGDNEPNP
jgi:uncharacterized protein